MNQIKTNNNNQYNLTVESARKDIERNNSEINNQMLKDMATFRRMDYSYFLVSLILICFGLIMLFSASMSTSFATQDDNPSYYFIRQAIFSLIGLSVAIVGANFVPIDFFQKKTFFVGGYIATTFALGLVFVTGTEQMGAQRWLNLFGVLFQPSEIAKFMAVFVLAGYFSEIRKDRFMGKYRAESPLRQFWLDGRILFLRPVLAMGVWFVLIVAQPHLSGALIFAGICFMVFVAAKIPWKTWISGIIQLLPVLIAGILLLSLIFPHINDGQTLIEAVGERFAHSKARIETFADEEAVSEDQSYQTRQAEIAMGSGGLTGVGLGKGRQKYNYLPQIHNDYIFPAIAEELGYLGTMSVLILFFVQFFLGVRIALNAKNMFSALIAWGFSFLIILQVILNVGVAAKVVPATGITLPFFSYGGTSNIIFIIEIGMVLCVSKFGQREHKTLKESFDRQKYARSAKNAGGTTQ